MFWKIFKLFTYALTIVILVILGYSWYTLQRINDIPKFVVKHEEVYTKTFEIDKNMVSYLLFSTGSKGLTADDGISLNIGKNRARMGDGLTDSIMLILTNPVNRKIAVLSIPRDTYIEGKGARINASFNRGGVNSLLDDVELLTGVRASHAISLNFKAFADFVDAVGGVDIYIPTYVLDKEAHLTIDNPGCNYFDGAKALAFARSRHYLISNDGSSYRSEASSSDWGRIERQQALLRVVAAKILNPSLLTTLPALLDAVQSNITLDDQLTSEMLLKQARAWKDGIDQIYAATYPGSGKTLPESGAQVILPNTDLGTLLAQQLASKIGFNTSGGGSLIETLTVTTDSAGVPLTPLNALANQDSLASQINTVKKNFTSERSASGAGGLYYHSCSN